MPIKKATKNESRQIDLYSILPRGKYSRKYCKDKTGETIRRWYKQGKVELIYLTHKTVVAVLSAPEERDPEDTSTRYWPLKFVEDYLEVTERTIKNWAKKDYFTIDKLNKAYLVDKHSFNAWINKLRREQNET